MKDSHFVEFRPSTLQPAQPSPAQPPPSVLMERLPYILIQNIFNFIAHPQPNTLLEDIRTHYGDTKHIKQIYMDYNNNFMNEENGDIYWLINDITRFLNNDIGTLHGYQNDFYKTWMRHRFLNSKVDVDRTVRNLEKKYCLRYFPQLTEQECRTAAIRHINLTLGLMTPQERAMLIAYLENVVGSVIHA